MDITEKKRKIGILTYHYSFNNYGAVLQGYSMYKLIEIMGFDSYLINYVPKNDTPKKKIIHAIKKSLGFRFEKFRRKHTKRIPNNIIHEENLKELNNKLDGFVVGSDQVWRYRDNENELLSYFLNFAGLEKLKIAYGVSFGVDSWEGDQQITNKIRNLINKFHAVSVREESGIKICKQIFNVNSSKILDPTLVLNKQYFYNLANVKIIQGKTNFNYLAYMLLDESKEAECLFKNIAKNNGLKFYNIKGIPIMPKYGFYLFNSISLWLNNIKNAELVITDSFHCTVFSIIFHKKFVCIANEYRGITRLINLLEMINLKSRLFKSLNNVKEDFIFSEIDYKNVDQRLEFEKKKSITFLKQNLSKVY